MGWSANKTHFQSDIKRAWENLFNADFNASNKGRIETAEWLNAFLIPAVQDNHLFTYLKDRLEEDKSFRGMFIGNIKKHIVKTTVLVPNNSIDHTDAMKNGYELIFPVLEKEEEKNGLKNPKSVIAINEFARKKGFFSDPYWNSEQIKSTLTTKAIGRIKNESGLLEYNPLVDGLIETIDSVSLTCTAMLYIWKLFGKESDSLSFFDDENKDNVRVDIVDVIRIINISVEKIIEWHIKDEGWSWGPKILDYSPISKTELPTDLYSSWTAACALSEIDTHIFQDHEWTSDWSEEKVQSYFGFDPDEFWLCIEETKNYITSEYLEDMSLDVVMTELCQGGRNSLYNEDIWPVGVNEDYTNAEVMKLNNDLYALDIAILFYADMDWNKHRPRKEVKFIPEVRVKIESSVQKIFRYYHSSEEQLLVKPGGGRSPYKSYRECLQQSEYYFLFTPGEILKKNYLHRKEDWFIYGDRSFLSLFLRVVASLIRYGKEEEDYIASPLFLEYIAEQLYVDLLLRRCKVPEYRDCWDGENFTIYSTERSLEALTELLLTYHSIDSESIGLPGGLPPGENLYSIEFAHVKNYVNISHEISQYQQERIEVLKDSLLERDQVSSFINNKPNHALCVLVDDYNKDAKKRNEKTQKLHIDLDMFAKDLKDLGFNVDFMAYESDIAKEVAPQLESDFKNIVGKIMSVDHRTNKDYASGTYLITDEGNDNILIKHAGRGEKEDYYACSFLTACWYLMRLGINPYLKKGIEKVRVFNDHKTFVSKELINYLPNIKQYIESEGEAIAIVKQIIEIEGLELEKFVSTVWISQD